MKPTRELLDDIFRERVLRARRTPPAEKFLDGFRLFDLGCRIALDGIRYDHPVADEQCVRDLLARRLGLDHASGGSPITTVEAVQKVIDALDTLGVGYMLVGSFSSSFYGIPRMTKDADFVIDLDALRVPEIARLLGTPFRLDPQMSFETVTMTTRHTLEIADPDFTTFQVEFFHLSDDPHDRERFRRRRRVSLLDRDVFLPTAEDVIVTKLRWIQEGQRSKDWDDIRGIIAVRGEGIDWAYVYHWCDQHGTRAVLEEIRRSTPPT